MFRKQIICYIQKVVLGAINVFCKGVAMKNDYNKFLEGLEGIEFVKTSDEDIARLKELFSDKIPEILLETYAEHVPADDVEFGDFVFYGIDRIIEENSDYVPGANIHPFGLFTFASTFDGDSICFDSNNSAYPVYQCSHELLGDEDEISIYKEGKFHDMPFTYENVIKVSACLADSFEDFATDLLNDDAGTYSVTEMLEDF